MRLFELEDIHEFDATWKIVLSRCTDVVRWYKETQSVLCRGVGNLNDNIAKLHTPARRPPVDTPRHIHDYVDEILKKNGMLAIRNNSIFVWPRTLYDMVGKISMGTYGTAYIIFPENGFDFTWSPQIVDLYQAIPAKAKYKTIRDTDYLWNDEIRNNILNLINNSGYTNKDFTTALKRENEIMIANCYYYAFKISVYGDLLYKKLTIEKNATL